MSTLQHVVVIPDEDKLRSRNWGTIVYDESVNPDYLRILEESGIEAVISPLHDKDKVSDDPDCQEYKKPHRHVILKYSGLKSRKQVKEFVSAFGGVGAEAIKSMPGSVQYLWHANNPEKAQYDKNDCVCLNGFRLEKYMPKLDRDDGYCQVIGYIEENDITHYSALMRDIIKDRPDLINTCRRDSYAIVNYLKSRDDELKRQEMLNHSQLHGSSEINVPAPWNNGFKRVPKDFDFQGD